MPWIKQKKKKSKNIRLYMGIVILCVLIAVIINMVFNLGRDLIEGSMDLADINKENLKVEKIRQEFKDGIDPDYIEVLESEVNIKYDQEDFERLKKLYIEKGRISKDKKK